MGTLLIRSACRSIFAQTSLLAIGTMLLPTALAAQPAPAEAAPAANPAAVEAKTAEPGALADIVVTAQRRSESSQRAAIPLVAISPTTLGNAGVVSPTTLNSAVPALVVQKAGGANTIFYIRGVGNFTVNAYADPAVAINLDGVYLGRPTSPRERSSISIGLRC